MCGGKGGTLYNGDIFFQRLDKFNAHQNYGNPYMVGDYPKGSDIDLMQLQ